MDFFIEINFPVLFAIFPANPQIYHLRMRPQNKTGQNSIKLVTISSLFQNKIAPIGVFSILCSYDIPPDAITSQVVLMHSIIIERKF